MEARITAVEHTISALEKVFLAKFEQSNEWRSQLDTERAAYARQDEELAHRRGRDRELVELRALIDRNRNDLTPKPEMENVRAKVEALSAWQDRISGAMWLLYAMAVSGAISAIVQLIGAIG